MLNIHFGENEDEARRRDPEHWLDYASHQLIFKGNEDAFRDLTLFYRLSDFHLDCTFIGGDIPALKTETEEAMNRVHDFPVVEQLGKLVQVWVRAVRTGKNVFVKAGQ